jgi:hypothetical protein
VIISARPALSLRCVLTVLFRSTLPTYNPANGKLREFSIAFWDGPPFSPLGLARPLRLSPLHHDLRSRSGAKLALLPGPTPFPPDCGSTRRGHPLDRSRSPDGTANVALAQAMPDSVAKLVGRDTGIYFITEDIETKYKEWSSRGVRFESPPNKPQWGGIFTRFEDPDGNSFGLVGFDELTLGVETRRRALVQKLEAERQVERELEIAHQVQARLLPQRMPEARTLDYAGVCLPARHVGGDCYDFLDLGQQRLGLGIGDIAGKGIAAALLMANLQANLRSQCATAAEQPNQFLQSVNQLFFENTADGDYATFFFSEYDDASRRPSLRQLRTPSRSASPARWFVGTAPLHRHGPRSLRQVGVRSRRAAAIPGRYTGAVYRRRDRILQQFREEFGDHRLIESLHNHRALSPSALIDSIVADVRKFNPHEQQDDITLLVGRVR